MPTIPADFKVWDGIHAEFDRNSGSSDAFGERDAIDRVRSIMKSHQEKSARGEPVEQVSIFHEYPLPIVVALLTGQASVRVLDFGGGLGQTYLSVRATLPEVGRIKFYILEHPELAREGRALFRNDTRVRFIDGFESAPQTVDVVHAGSSFQYVDDWRGLLRQFASLSPRFIVFGNLLAGDIEPFVTRQAFFDCTIPVRFHNLQEILMALQEYGYKLLFDAFHEQTILGTRQPLPLDNLPQSRRLIYGRNLILSKS